MYTGVQFLRGHGVYTSALVAQHQYEYHRVFAEHVKNNAGS